MPATRRFLLSSLAALALLASAAAPVSTALAAPKPGEVRIGVTFDLSTLDPQLMTNLTDVNVSQNINEGLVRFKLGAFEIEPALAESWSVSSDNLTWTFKLVQNAEFQKGYGKFTADDVVFTLERLVSERLRAPNRALIGSFKSVAAIDPYTVELKLSAPDPSLLVKLATWSTAIVSRKAVTEIGASYPTNPIGTGPYQFDSWKTGESIVLVPNPTWRGKKPTLNRVVYLPVSDPTTMHNAFEAGDIDFMPLADVNKLVEYQSNPDFIVESMPGLWTRFFGYKTTVEPFNNPLVREAINYAIDRDGLVKNLFKGLSAPADGIFSPAVQHRASVISYQHDPEKARKLLAQAGYPNGFSVEMTVPNYNRFIDPATAIQADLAKIGVKVSINPMEVNTFISTLSTEKGFPLYLLARGQDPTPDRVIKLWLHSSSIPTTNWARIADPEIDAWVNEGLSTMDEKVRQDVFRKAQEKFAKTNGYYYIDHENSIVVLHKWVKGFVNDARTTLRVDNVTIER